LAALRASRSCGEQSQQGREDESTHPSLRVMAPGIDCCAPLRYHPSSVK
jgi:hypothetical protein